MTIGSKKESVILFLGDLCALTVAFWLALFIRAGSLPSVFTLKLHAVSLLPLSIIWLFVFFVAGLYEKNALIFEKKLSSLILNTQIVNSIIAVIFFYFFAAKAGITPKTILLLYLVISTIFIILWRRGGTSLLGFKQKERAIIIGSGEEMHILKDEVNQSGRYNIIFASSVDLSQIEGIDFKTEILNRMYTEDITSVVIDLRNEKADVILPILYNLIFSGVRFYDIHKIYEEVFERIPLSLVRYSWFLENISSSAHIGYDFLKRGMDIVGSLCLGIVSFVFYPFVFCAIKLDDWGSVFIAQNRIGKDGKTIKLYKFRSMSRNEIDLNSGKTNKITRVGAFLRKTRIDELPQLWNVFCGDLSLIGPRPELPSGVAIYEREIPYYNIRHLIKPGLSGWAQLYHNQHPHHGVDTEETRNKLSYDLFYLKNRSFILDMVITLKTIKTLISRTGS